MSETTELRAAIREHLAAGRGREAWALLPEVAALCGDSPEVALTWLETARITWPHSGDALADAVERIAETFDGDETVMFSGAATLVAALSRRPVDQPNFDDAVARTAVALTTALLARDLNPGHRAMARAQHGNALRLSSRQHDDEALAHLEAAIEAQPEVAGNYSDLGLFHKSRGRFSEAQAAFERARVLGLPGKALLFNIAVCATAQGDGEAAKEAFGAFGVPVEVNAAGMPIVMAELPPVEVRVPTRGSGHGVDPAIPDEAYGFEVVSVAALSPCHGVVQTPTLRDAPVDYGDVILWDGMPVDVRREGDAVVPLFPLLEILRRGDERRYRFVALEQGEGDIAALGELLPAGTHVFPLVARVESVCTRCAAGEALIKHEHSAPEPHRIVHGKLVAEATVSLEHLARALHDAIRATGAVTLAVPELYEALPDTKRAGQEHQAYRGIEQVALRRGLAGSRDA